MGEMVEEDMIEMFILRSIGCGEGKENDWKGLEAALVLSKQQNAEKKSPSNDNDSVLSEEDIGLIKKKGKFCSQEEPTTWFKADRELFRTTAELVADATELVNSSINWKFLPIEFRNGLTGDVFGCIIRFVLSMLDLDDISNAETKKRQTKYRSLFKKLNPLAEDVHYTRKEIDRMLMGPSLNLILEKQKRAMSCIAEERLDVKAFAGLNERDVDSLIDSTMIPGWRVNDVTDWFAPRVMTSKGDVTEQVIDEMEKFIPLKVEYKVRLNLEVANERCYRIVDYLFVEACKGFITNELLEALEGVLGSSYKAKRRLSLFLETLHKGVSSFVNVKASMIAAYQRAFLRPLRKVPFRYAEDEVLEVVTIADHERRIRGHRFIGVHTILLGLSFSRVRDHHLVRSAISNNSPDKPPEMPAYKIYKLAAECAEHYSNQDNKVRVRLEHLTLAVISVNEQKEQQQAILFNEEYMTGLRAAKTVAPEVVNGSDLTYDDEPIAHYETLIHAIINGLELPEDIRAQP